MNTFTRNLACIILCVFAASLQAQAQDSLRHDPAEYLSGTLPVLYVNTVDSMPVVSREDYLQGTYWLDAGTSDKYGSIGSAEQPLPLQIRGRGNASWHNPKKPYRLKLDKKAALLGMPKSKHWVLLTAYADWRAHARDYMLLTIARLMQMPWTPGIVPCEVVLNNDYIGMYFLVENIRVEKTRVNIEEQSDLQTHPDSISGGWLLEIDNYEETNQVKLKDKDGSTMRITYHSPEELSPQQETYLTELLNKTNAAINTNDKASREWEQYIDIDALARFYVVNEVVDNQEAFSGSCWFYKDLGDSAKFVFGPVWDGGSTLGSRLSNNQPDFIYNASVSYVHNHWIKEVAQFPRFQIALRKYWKYYRDNVYPQMEQVVADYKAMTQRALECDYRRWSDGSAIAMDYYAPGITRALTTKLNFLKNHWDADYVFDPCDLNYDGKVDVVDLNLVINVLLNDIHPAGGIDTDINGDGVTDINDVNQVINTMIK